MVRGLGDLPKRGTRKSIGCPVYPISQWFYLKDIYACVKQLIYMLILFL